MSFRSFRKFAAAAAVCCAAVQMTSADLQAQTVDHVSVKGNYKLFLTLVSRDSPHLALTVVSMPAGRVE